MQEGVESGFVRRDAPDEPSGLEKIQQEFSKILDSAKSKAGKGERGSGEINPLNISLCTTALKLVPSLPKQFF